MTESDEDRIRALEAYAEKAYDEMYEARSAGAAGGYFSEVKECLTEAIRIARAAGRPRDVTRLTERLEHIRTVYEKHLS